MAKIAVKGVAIEAIYSCVPKSIIRTSDYSSFSEAESKLFEKTTGISERRVASEKNDMFGYVLRGGKENDGRFTS